MSGSDNTPNKPMFLTGVEDNPEPGPYLEFIRSMKNDGHEYPQIWYMFAFRPKATRTWRGLHRRSCESPGR